MNQEKFKSSSKTYFKCYKAGKVLKAGKPSVPLKKMESQSGPPAAAGGVTAPTVYLTRELLEGLGIDPDTLEVRIRVQGPGEQERPPGGGGAARLCTMIVSLGRPPGEENGGPSTGGGHAGAVLRASSEKHVEVGDAAGHRGCRDSATAAGHAAG